MRGCACAYSDHATSHTCSLPIKEIQYQRCDEEERSDTYVQQQDDILCRVVIGETEREDVREGDDGETCEEMCTQFSDGTCADWDAHHVMIRPSTSRHPSHITHHTTIY